MRSSGTIVPCVRRWIERSIGLLETRGYLVRSGEQLNVSDSAPPEGAAAWKKWESRKAQYFNDPDWASSVQAVEEVLRALPDILSGRRAAAEILSVGVAPAAIPAIAKLMCSGPIASFCNDAVARATAQYIHERRRLDPHCELRILEIGAGTDSLTGTVLRAIEPYAARLKEYACSTGSMPLAADRSYVTHRPFDLRQSPETQGIALDNYDLVIASRVLHTATDGRVALRNAKAVLKTNGRLLLHELVATTTLNHLTIGLLDELWPFAGIEPRVPSDSVPGAEISKSLLRQAGFNSMLFLAEKAHVYGHQVVVAESDGVIRQRLLRPSFWDGQEERPNKEPDHTAEPRAADEGKPATIDEIMSKPRDVVIEHLLSRIRLHTAAALGVDVATLDLGSRPFADMLLSELGVDSLSSADVRNALRRELGVDIPIQRIIGKSVHIMVDSLYDELIIRRMSSVEVPGTSDDRETYVF
jgi:SAM-dependent methyltransferase